MLPPRDWAVIVRNFPQEYKLLHDDSNPPPDRHPTFIRDRIAQQGQPPLLAEIAGAFGFASRSVRASMCWR